ncbi:MAG TPA: hypothetical protein ENJ90_03125 [Devosia sp.]|nr:hypothetical protein [Devosia sp.]
MTKPGKRREQLMSLVSGAGVTPANPPALLPASDYFDLAGEEFGARLLLTTGADGLQYCLRPDFTLPIAKACISGEGVAPAAFSYLGPVFRQRAQGPVEFEQAGLELVGQPDPEAALSRVFEFTAKALGIYGVSTPAVRLGSVALFEALLEAADMPPVWRPRLRRRFGSRKALTASLDRLTSLNGNTQTLAGKSRNELIEDITGQMLESGLSLVESRTPEEIADRFLEKQALAVAKVPEKTIALLRAYLAISGPVEQALAEAEELFSANGLSLEKPLSGVAAQAKVLAALLPDAVLSFEAGFSPRLHYYTGLVFEIAGEGGDILASGGQYDRLLQSLGAQKEVSASGCALWVARLEGEAGR